MNPLLALGGSVIGGLFNYMGTEQTNQNNADMLASQEAFSAGQAQLNRDFQAQMSNTAYQRASADMKAAGLNPAAMFGSGGAATTPSGSAASAPSAAGQRVSGMSTIGSSIKDALQSEVTAKVVDKLTSEVANVQADSKLKDAQTRLAFEQAGKTGEETTQLQARRPVAAFEGITASELVGLAKEHPDLYSNLVRWGYVAKKGEEVVGPVFDALSSAGKLAGGVGLLRGLAGKSNPTSASKSYTGLSPSGRQEMKDQIDEYMSKFRKTDKGYIGGEIE